MIRLVVNADDAGVDAARDRGILRALREGIVTSASVLAAFPASGEFLREAGGARTPLGEPPGIGLHLNLSEGKPLASGVASLVDAGLRFPGKRELWRRALAGRIDPAHVLKEVEAQWGWLAARGVAPDHLDGHNHAHVLPGAVEAIAAAVPAGIWVRLPREGAPSPAVLAGSPEEIFSTSSRLSGALGELSRSAVERWRGRFRWAEGFLGLGLTKGYGSEELIAALEDSLAGGGTVSGGSPGSRPPGPVLELMVHPGEVDERSLPFSRVGARSREVQALTDPALRAFLEKAEVRLSSFGAIP